MKNIVISCGLLVVVLLSFVGCGKSAVECDDSEATKLVMEITEMEAKDQLVHRKNTLANYKFWKSQTENTDVQNAIKEIDQQWVEAEAKIIDIRTDDINNELEKTTCSASISYANGNKTDITYKLSKTSEGKLFAEVFGLK